MKKSRIPMFAPINLRWSAVWMIAFFIIVLLILVLTAVKTNAQTLTFGKTDFVTYQKDSSFSISVPDYLVQVNDLDPRASLQFKNIYNETYLMVVPETKSADGHVDLQQLQLDFEANLLFNGALLTHREEIKLGDGNAFQNQAEWTIEGRPFAYLITFIDTPNTLYKIYCWTLASQKEYLADFQKALGTFFVMNKLSYSNLIGSAKKSPK